MEHQKSCAASAQENLDEVSYPSPSPSCCFPKILSSSSSSVHPSIRTWSSPSWCLSEVDVSVALLRSPLSCWHFHPFPGTNYFSRNIAQCSSACKNFRTSARSPASTLLSSHSVLLHQLSFCAERYQLGDALSSSLLAAVTGWARSLFPPKPVKTAAK